MDQDLRKQIDLLLSEAELATDERSNGLMDRADFRHLIDKFAQTTLRLKASCDQLERERNELSRRPCRSAPAPAVTNPLHVSISV